MRLTHLGHACLLVEIADQRILIDPGVYSSGFEDLTDLSAVLVTHQHPDHIDMDRVPSLLSANAEARLLVEPDTAVAAGISSGSVFAAGSEADIASVHIRGVGGQHAVNHDQIQPIGNVGYVISADGEPTLFHPGDMYAETPADVDVLALPLNAPWAKMAETLTFLRAVEPRVAVPIHDGLLNSTGRDGYLMHVTKFGPSGTEVRDLSDGQPAAFS